MKNFCLLEDSRHRKVYRFFLLAVSAFFCALTLVVPKLDLLEWVSLVPMAIAVFDISRDTKVRKRGLYGYGFFFYFCFYAVSFHWFVNMYPLEFIDGMTKFSALVVVLAGCVGLSVLQASGAGVLFVLFAVAVRRVCFDKRAFWSVVFLALLASSLWTILEWSQTIGWVGVPWARLSIGQMGFFVGAQSASLFGCCFVTFLIVFVNFLIAGAIICADGRKTLSVIAASVFLLNAAFGTVMVLRNTRDGEPIKVAAIQGNISSQEKWSLSHTQKTLDVYEKYTVEAAEQGAKIVVWPESALPYNITNDIRLLDYISDLARENQVTLLVGAFTYGEDEEYNSIVTVLPDGRLHETVYSKRHLVPFGEYVPMRSLFEVLIPPLTEISMLSYDLSEGKSANVIELEEADIGALICFDSIYDKLARDSVRSGAELLSISTNDSWFSDSAALRMHNSQAALRSIENGRYTIRAANTGISSVIAPNGKTMESLDALEEGYICTDVYARNERTLYSYLGNFFVYLCVLWVILCCFCEILISNFRKSLDKRTLK